jgi:hypothetical protein
MMILSQYHIFELDTINIYSAFALYWGVFKRSAKNDSENRNIGTFRS